MLFTLRFFYTKSEVIQYEGCLIVDQTVAQNLKNRMYNTMQQLKIGKFHAFNIKLSFKNYTRYNYMNTNSG